MAVSVSSLGSNSLQPASGDANSNLYLCFSILSRIEFAATSARRWSALSSIRVSVSSLGSNSLQLRAPASPAQSRYEVSVSSLGSNSLQPYGFVGEASNDTCFSILSRIEFAATLFAYLGPGVPGSVSVSSLGSNSLQLGRLAGCDLPVSGFQYPLSDRIRCNRKKDPPHPTRTRVSVSSLGSNSLQRGSHDSRCPRPDKVSVSSLGSNSLQL